MHSLEDYESVLQVSELLFNRKASKEQLLALKEGDLKTVASEIPSFSVPKEKLANGSLTIIDLLAEETAIVSSKGNARRAIKGNAISVNKDKIQHHEAVVNHEALLHGKYIMVENGKKNKYMVVAE